LPAEIIDGKAIAARVRARAAAATVELTAAGVRPGLAVVLVGSDPASEVYVRGKVRACEEAGMHSVNIVLPQDTTQARLLEEVRRLNDDPAVHGILVQMPLPPHMDAGAVINAVRPEKDVDGFHPVNVGKLLNGDEDGFRPCTPAGVQVMLQEAGVSTQGSECVIVGRSNIVGKPMAAMLLQNSAAANATVTVCHSRTRDLAAHTRRADILVAATGKPKLITREMVKPGAVVVDVGVNRVPDSGSTSGFRLVGDVDFESVREVARLITPVPGGVGPMTIAMLLDNTVRAARRTLS